MLLWDAWRQRKARKEVAGPGKTVKRSRAAALGFPKACECRERYELVVERCAQGVMTAKAK